MEWVRARTEAQVQIRTDQILAAAGRLLVSQPWAEITMGMVAQEAGFTRSNLYKYFTLKEEIFLALFIDEAEDWVNDRIRSWAIGEARPTDVLAREWVDSLLEREGLSRLFVLLYSALEPVVPPDGLLRLKMFLAAAVQQLALSLSRHLGGRDPGELQPCVMALISLFVGSKPLLSLTSDQQAAMTAADLPVDQDYYRDLIVESSRFLIQGYASRPT